MRNEAEVSSIAKDFRPISCSASVFLVMSLCSSTRCVDIDTCAGRGCIQNEYPSGSGASRILRLRKVCGAPKWRCFHVQIVVGGELR